MVSGRRWRWGSCTARGWRRRVMTWGCGGWRSGTPRAALRREVCTAAAGAGTEQEFFTRLAQAGVLVRLRHSTTSPGQVTGYAITLPGHAGPDRAPRWYGGGRLAAGLTLPQLRRHWAQPPNGAPGRGRAFWFTAPERDTIYQHASRQAAAAAAHIRRCAYSDPAAAADAAWAAADALHVAARALRSPVLRCAADTYDRAARAGYGRIPRLQP